MAATILRLAAALAAAILVSPPAMAQGAEAHALLERASRLFEMGDRAGLAGDHRREAQNYHQAIELVDQAMAIGDPVDPAIVGGRREMILSLGDAYVKARQHGEALATFSGLAGEIGGADHAIPAGRAERLHYAKALRGLVDAGVNSRDFAAAREALPRLIATGRAMHADEPSNTYLTRRLAQDMQAEVVFRWVLQDGPGSAAMARETLALFRSLAETNPNSADTRRSRFLWAYGAALLNEDDIELWREAVESGEQLVGRRQMASEHAGFLREAQSRLARLKRAGR